MIIPLGQNDWDSVGTNVNRLRLHNMYLVDNPWSPDQISRISRPTLSAYTTVGIGPIMGVFQQDGAFNGDTFVVSNNSLYRLSDVFSTYVGEVTGVDYPQFAGSTSNVFIVRDGTGYNYDGTTLSIIVMPGSVQVKAVACMDSVFFLSVLNTQAVYWMNPGDVVPDPLNFITVARQPDPITAIEVKADELWFIGTKGVEVWRSTGILAYPYVRIPGRVYTEGCLDISTVVTSAYKGTPALLWVTDKSTVVMAQGAPICVSNDSIETYLQTATNLRAWTFRNFRNDFYVLSSDQGTFAFDITRQEWSRWDSYGYEYFLGHLGTQTDNGIYAGDATSNHLYKLIEGTSDNGLPVIKEVSGFIPHTGKQEPCYSVNVGINAGWGPSYTKEPLLELRWSDDLGSTWSDYIQHGLGLKGQYNDDITFRSLGLLYRPGRDFEFRISDDTTIRIDYATMNEV